jgi:hypothetical protein
MQKQRFIPSEAVKVTDKQSDAVAYLYEMRGNPCAVAYVGKQTKPAIFARFLDTQRRERAIQDLFSSRQSALTYKAARKAQDSKPHGFQLGHILMSSWGYEQTNINWFEITKIIGDRMIEIRPIGAVVDYTGDMSGTCTPRAGDYIGDAMRLRVSRGSVKVSSCARASLWDGRPRHWSSWH